MGELMTETMHSLLVVDAEGFSRHRDADLAEHRILGSGLWSNGGSMPQ